jgi:hypothetical protein
LAAAAVVEMVFLLRQAMHEAAVEVEVEVGLLD